MSYLNRIQVRESSSHSPSELPIALLDHGAGNCLAKIVAALGVLILSVTLSGDASAQGEFDDLVLEPIQFVVLIDESGSLDPEDVEAEKRAAIMLTSLELSDDSLVAVLGFGSEGAVTPAVRDHCSGLQRLGGPGGRRTTAICTSRAAAREDGGMTDHYSALREALRLLADAPEGSQRVVFLLTDGLLNPGAGPLGETPVEAAANAFDRINTEIREEAERQGVQIWPLGFGSADSTQLDLYAEVGAGPNARCPRFSAPPTSVVVADSSQVLEKLITAAAGARCQQVSTAGDTPDTLTIPVLATDGAVGIPRTPGETVTFYPPVGEPVVSGSTPPDPRYSIIETDEAVVVRFTDVGGGEWRVESGDSAPEGLLALWEARVETRIDVPPHAPAGETVSIALRVRTRTGPIENRETLERASFAIEATTTDGRALQVSRVMIDEQGRGTATFTMPSDCPESIAIAAVVDAEGFNDESRPVEVQCRGTSSGTVRGSVTASCQNINSGGEFAVTVDRRNPTQSAATFGLVLEDMSPSGWTFVEANNDDVVAAGTEAATTVLLTAPEVLVRTAIEGRISLLDSTDEEQRLLDDADLCGYIEIPPPPVVPPWWRWVLLAAGFAGAAALVMRRQLKKTTSGLTATLYSARSLVDEYQLDAARELPLQVSHAGRTVRFERDVVDPAYLVRPIVRGVLRPRVVAVDITDTDDDSEASTRHDLPTRIQVDRTTYIEITPRDEDEVLNEDQVEDAEVTQ